MKPRDVKRSVRSSRVERSAGDAPSIGRVARVPVSGKSKGERRRRRGVGGGNHSGDRARNNRRKVVLAWSIVFMAIAVLVMVAAVVMWATPNRDRSEDVVGKPLVSVQERVVSRFESPPEDEALALVKRALAVREPSEVATYFRPGSASPQEIVAFLASMPKEDGKMTGMDWLSSMDVNGMLIDGVMVNFAARIPARNRLALLTPDQKGVWKIDYDALARTVKPSWTELVEGNADQALVRVIVAPDSYYNGTFRDESLWSCFGMVSPDREGVLLGYCRKGTPQAAAMDKIVSAEKSPGDKSGLRRATLEIKRVAGAESRQFEIIRVLAEDWVVGEKPFDGNFK